MPQAMTYVQPNDKSREALESFVSGERHEREKVYNDALKYYDGDMKKYLSMKNDEPDDNIVINLVQMAVDRTIAFLFPSMPSLELAPEESEETEEEKWLRLAWDENKGVAKLNDAALNGALSGHAYARLYPKRVGDKYPRIAILDPRVIITYWKADDIDTVLWHEIRWTIPVRNGVQDFLQDIVFDEDSQTWRILEYVRGAGTGRGAGWKLSRADEWPFVLGPIVHTKHLNNPGNFYGRSEIKHKALNDKINLILSENARINRYHASPKTIATGVGAEEVKETAIDDMFAIDSPEAKVYNLEMQTELTAGQSLAAFLHDSYLAQSRVVILRGEVKDFQRVTNTGVRTVFIDMLAKNVVLRYNYGKFIQEISQRLFMLDRRTIDLVPEVKHHDPLPSDDLEKINIAAIERNLGTISRQDIAQERGRNWTEQVKKQEEEAKLSIFQAPKPAETPQAEANPNAKDTEVQPR